MLRPTTTTTASPSAISGVVDTRAPRTVLVLRFSPRLPGATMIPRIDGAKKLRLAFPAYVLQARSALHSQAPRRMQFSN